MATTKVAVTIDENILQEVDRLVANGQFPNRSRAFQAGLQRLIEDGERRGRLLRELARIDPEEEKALAEEAFAGEVPWPEY